jgi:hypothetical protein
MSCVFPGLMCCFIEIGEGLMKDIVLKGFLMASRVNRRL